jgi:hypothetical protein
MRNPVWLCPAGFLICLMSNPRRDTLAEAGPGSAYPAIWAVGCGPAAPAVLTTSWVHELVQGGSGQVVGGFRRT